MCTAATAFEIVTSPAAVDANPKAAFGVLFAKGTDAAVIAKWVREDIARAQKLGAFRGLKIAVRIKRASMCREVNVIITGAEGCAVFNMERLVSYARGGSARDGVSDYSPRIDRALRLLEIVLCQYAFSDCDPTTDYFNVNFWPHVGVDLDLELADREPRVRRALLSVVRDAVATVEARGELTDDRPALAVEALARGDARGAFDALDGCDGEDMRPLKVAVRAACVIGKFDNVFDAARSVYGSVIGVFARGESEKAAEARFRNHIVAA